MTSEGIHSILILADESANWKIGGLRQLERLALAANELAAEKSLEIEIIVFWKPDITECWLPDHPCLTNVRLATLDKTSSPGGPTQILTTRLLVTRRGLPEFFSATSCSPCIPGESTSTRWEELSREFFETNWANVGATLNWRHVSDENEIPNCQHWLLRSTGKSYDGAVSRYVNRPISRFVSRFILPSPITPNQWTGLILLLAVAACWFLSRGSYLGFVIGTAFYQLHSILDGCDGEIARVKYLDSKRGPGIDALGDLLALLLFVAGLTVGLCHQASGNTRWIFLTEGLVAFGLIALRLGRHTLELLARGMDAVRSSEHDQLIRKSGDHYFGRTLNSFAIAVTRRDVVFLLFFIVALIGLASLIMHLLFVYSLGAVLLVLKGHSMRSAREVRPVLP